jgi:hypothetical protein
MDWKTATFHLALMTFSGEIFTYMINTFSSTARECFMWNLLPGMPMSSGGDDIMRMVVGRKNQKYLEYEHQDPCIDKRYESTRGDFTGFIVTHGRVYKDPVILFKRLMAQLARGNGENVALGYFDLWMINYNHGERIFDDLDEVELMHSSALNRIMFNLRKIYGVTTNMPWERIQQIDAYVSPDAVERVLDSFSDDRLWEKVMESDPISIPTIVGLYNEGLTAISNTYSELSQVTSYTDEY